MRAPSPGWMAYMQSQLEREQHQKEYGKKRASSMTYEKCPLCGARLYKRRGKYGEFLGCGNYPTCKYTKQI
ncbi:MAG: topoisomerase DNA-binding C4 zinc finger domain-containing protein [Clostridia bacterium]|nr:topoisomerase DNA-binding C4 zinc finger domain-containing protein [Clostridia bacterium]